MELSYQNEKGIELWISYVDIHFKGKERGGRTWLKLSVTYFVEKSMCYDVIK